MTADQESPSPAASRREQILDYLMAHGGVVESSAGRGLTRELAAAVGYDELSALNAMLARLERDGVVNRHVRGRRTYRISLSAPRVASPAAAVAVVPGRPNEVLPQHEVLVRRFEHELCRPRGLLRACLLVLLQERAGHGYELNERLQPFGLDREDPSRVYRALRWLESAGFVQPAWETSAVGPARRVFELTPAGHRALEVCAPSLHERNSILSDYLSQSLPKRARSSPGRKRPFEVVVEATLRVQAFDEVSARRKVERALGRARVVDADVSTTGEVRVQQASLEEPAS